MRAIWASLRRRHSRPSIDQTSCNSGLTSFQGWTGAARRNAAEWLLGKATELRSEASAAVVATVPGRSALRIGNGGFHYGNTWQKLPGKALECLRSLIDAGERGVSRTDLFRAHWSPEAGEDNVRVQIGKAREAVRKAIQKATGAASARDPIPCVDRGDGATAWKIDLGVNQIYALLRDIYASSRRAGLRSPAIVAAWQSRDEFWFRRPPS